MKEGQVQPIYALNVENIILLEMELNSTIVQMDLHFKIMKLLIYLELPKQLNKKKNFQTQWRI